MALTEEFEIDRDTACKALTGFGLSSPLGLHFHSSGQDIEHGIGTVPLFSPSEKTVNGLRVSMASVELDFVLDTRGSNPTFFEEQEFYRPWMIDLNGPQRTARIFLTWASQRKKILRVGVEIKKKS